jgi:hypothetical protein
VLLANDVVRLVWDGDTAKFIARDGRRFRIYDVCSFVGKGLRVPLGDPSATHRILKPASGAKLAHVLRDHVVSEERLDDQLSRAGYIGKQVYRGPGAGDPR